MENENSIIVKKLIEKLSNHKVEKIVDEKFECFYNVYLKNNQYIACEFNGKKISYSLFNSKRDYDKFKDPIENLCDYFFTQNDIL